eukprot:Rhum_TRINITY_DN13019_c0_g3::Rhum_TRINITY_DN13019_c0_g3_i1::g.56243::m.56243
MDSMEQQKKEQKAEEEKLQAKKKELQKQISTVKRALRTELQKTKSAEEVYNAYHYDVVLDDESQLATDTRAELAELAESMKSVDKELESADSHYMLLSYIHTLPLWAFARERRVPFAARTTASTTSVPPGDEDATRKVDALQAEKKKLKAEEKELRAQEKKLHAKKDELRKRISATKAALQAEEVSNAVDKGLDGESRLATAMRAKLAELEERSKSVDARLESVGQLFGYVEQRLEQAWAALFEIAEQASEAQAVCRSIAAAREAALAAGGSGRTVAR